MASVSDSYGKAFGQRLSARATSFSSRALPHSTIAVTELRYDNPQGILSTPPAVEDAFVVAVHLKLFPRYEYWENGKAAPVSVLLPGETIIYDIKRKPTFYLNSRFHSVHFYLPQAAMKELAEQADAARFDELHYKPAVSHEDHVLRGMAEALVPLFGNPEQASPLLMDHLLLAVGHHIAGRYGGMRPMSSPVPGGLTQNQERRAKELLNENLSGDLKLATLASECSLPTARFSRAFRKSVGMPPHRWMIQQRIALAKTLLRDAPLSLAEIALACGFSDQSHFTRFFSAAVEVSPGLWRRNIRG